MQGCKRNYTVHKFTFFGGQAQAADYFANRFTFLCFRALRVNRPTARAGGIN